MDSRTITIALKPLDTVITRPVTQYDRGVELVLTGDDVHYDELSEIHLTRSGMDGAISYPIIPQTDGTGIVYIADSWWEQDTPVTGYIVHVYDASDRITEAEIRIPIRARSQEESITDDETEEARELLASIRESETNAKQSAEDAEHYAEILKQAQSVLPTVTVTRTQEDDGVVFTVTDTAGNVTETELHDGPIGPTGPAGKDGADGQDGKDGKDGENGQNGKDGADGQDGADGADGVSPVVTTTQTETGAEITITDKNGAHVVTLKNGEQGETGPAGQDGKDGEDGIGVPAGGSAGQVLTKASGINYDTAWRTPETPPEDMFTGTGGATVFKIEPSETVWTNTDKTLNLDTGTYSLVCEYTGGTTQRDNVTFTREKDAEVGAWCYVWKSSLLGVTVKYFYGNNVKQLSTVTFSDGIPEKFYIKELGDREINLKEGYTLGRSFQNLPAGGSAGQVLAKSTDDDYEVEWVNAGGSGGGALEEVSDIDYAEIAAVEYDLSIDVFVDTTEVAQDGTWSTDTQPETLTIVGIAWGYIRDQGTEDANVVWRHIDKGTVHTLVYTPGSDALDFLETFQTYLNYARKCIEGHDWNAMSFVHASDAGTIKVKYFKFVE